ncbi:MAG: hypothetical protein WCI77_08770 [Candidatus Omnitrophota bacterium]
MLFFRFITLCAIITMLPVSAFALRIDNPKIHTYLAVTDTYSDTINVENTLDTPVAVRIYLEDFVYVSPFDGTKEFYSPGTTDTSLASWISFAPQEINLAARERKEIKLNLKPNASFTKVHCGVLFFETTIGKGFDQEGKTVMILGRVGSLIIIEPKPGKKKAVFDALAAKGRSFTGSFTNGGETFLYAKGSYYIMDAKGIVADRGTTPELYTLPGNKTEIKISLPKDISPGDYTLFFNFDLEGGDVLVKEIDVSFSPQGEVLISNVRD